MPFFSSTTLLFALAALIAGALTPLQAGSNALLRRGFGHPLWATFTSLTIKYLGFMRINFCYTYAYAKFQRNA